MTDSNHPKYGRRITVRLTAETERKLIRLYKAQAEKLSEDSLDRVNLSAIVRWGLENLPEPT